jgi:hypothetical protein
MSHVAGRRHEYRWTSQYRRPQLRAEPADRISRQSRDEFGTARALAQARAGLVTLRGFDEKRSINDRGGVRMAWLSRNRNTKSRFPPDTLRRLAVLGRFEIDHVTSGIEPSDVWASCIVPFGEDAIANPEGFITELRDVLDGETGGFATYGATRLISELLDWKVRTPEALALLDAGSPASASAAFDRAPQRLRVGAMAGGARHRHVVRPSTYAQRHVSDPTPRQLYGGRTPIEFSAVLRSARAGCALAAPPWRSRRA